ncbi:MAG: hypothetical protein Q9P90_04745 [candidate division KSB1 bacterium]|nr:hypothetical protein [candidate division KSB1 bacterium]
MTRLWLVLCFLPAALSAQALTMQYRGAPLPVQAVQMQLSGWTHTVWKTEIDGVAHFVLPQSVLDSLLKKIEQQQAIIQRHEATLSHTQSLLEKYERFARAAHEHVAIQKQLIDTTAALYEGYKSMYRDLKRIMGISELALLLSLGVVDPPGGGWRPVGGVGVALRAWQVSYRFGRDYRGVEVGLRWPIGWWTRLKR